MQKKMFKTIDEQIQILKSKGLVIDDEDYVKRLLIRENYFFISGYRHLFLIPEGKNFRPETNFRELYAVFNFDRQIRNVIFKNLLIVENNVKSIFSYQLSKKYGIRINEYLKAANFNTSLEKSRQVNDLLKKMKRQIKVNGDQHTATQHYINHYGYVPLWVMVKVLSFGIVSELYNIMKYEDQKEIADIYGIEINNLIIYLPILSNYRNLCAHEDILYDHKTQRQVEDNRFHQALSIPKVDGEYIYGKNDLFSLIIILKQMLLEEEFTMLINEIGYEVDILDGKIKSVTIDKVLNKIGFPINYKEITKIN